MKHLYIYIYIKGSQTVDRRRFQSLIMLEFIFRPYARKLIMVVDNNIINNFYLFLSRSLKVK